jgi:hypothetical protein
LQEGKKLFSTEPEFVNLLSRSPGINSQPGEIDSSESIPGLHLLNTIRRSNWYRKIVQLDLSPTTVSVQLSTHENVKIYVLCMGDCSNSKWTFYLGKSLSKKKRSEEIFVAYIHRNPLE